MTLYPFSIIYLVFPLPWSLTYFCFGHLVLGAFGAYFLARRWAGNHFGCGLAGLAYIFNGVTFSCLLWPNYSVALGWMPWVVLWTEQSWRKGGRWLVVASLAAAMQLLSGVPEIVLFTWLALGVWWCETFLRGETPKGKLVFRAALVAILAASLCAIQLLPFLDLLAHSQRDRSWSNTKWPMPGWGWANLLVPLFHCFESFQGPFFQYGQEFLTSYYPGVGMLLLAWLGLSRAKRARAWTLFALVLVSLILALGDNGYLYAWAKQIFPFLGIARYPVKFVLLAAFCIPLLAAYAWTHHAPGQGNSKTILLPAVILLAGIGLVLWFARQYPFPYDQWPVTLKNGLGRAAWLVIAATILLALQRASREKSKTILQLALAAVLVGDVLTHTVEQNPAAQTAVMAPGIWKEFNSSEAPRLGQARIMISPQAESLLFASTERNATTDFLAKRRALWSNLNILEGVPKVNGSSTLQMKDQKKVEELLYQQTNSMPAGLLNFLTVSHYTSPSFALDYVARTNFHPLTTAGQTPEFLAPEDILPRLVSTNFNPLETVFLPVEARASITAKGNGNARVIRSVSSTRSAQLEVEADAAAMVVIAQSFHRGWKATVDGTPVRLWKANYAFQALEIPAGRHHVQLRYQEPLLGVGAGITGVALGACLAIWFFHPGRLPRLAAFDEEDELAPNHHSTATPEMVPSRESTT